MMLNCRRLSRSFLLFAGIELATFPARGQVVCLGASNTAAHSVSAQGAPTLSGRSSKSADSSGEHTALGAARFPAPRHLAVR